jgi:hypothetical protein
MKTSTTDIHIFVDGNEVPASASYWEFVPDITLDTALDVTPSGFDLLSAWRRSAVEYAETTSTPEVRITIAPYRWWHWPVRWIARLFGQEFPRPIAVHPAHIEVGEVYKDADGNLACSVTFEGWKKGE